MHEPPEPFTAAELTIGTLISLAIGLPLACCAVAAINWLAAVLS